MYFFPPKLLVLIVMDSPLQFNIKNIYLLINHLINPLICN